MYREICIGIALVLSLSVSKAQTADEIINAAIEKTGGKARWAALEGIKLIAKFDQGGIEFPLEIVQLADGRQYTRLTFQNNEIKQGVFDGNTLWSTDFQTLKPKMADPEAASNVRNDSNDFPCALFNYHNKGYVVKLLGKEQLGDLVVYKIQLENEPMTIDGLEVKDISYYYFDSKTFLPVALEFEMKHGPIKGSTMVITLGDYQEVQGFVFPFTMSQGVKDAPPQALQIESVEFNPKVNSDQFLYPGN